MRLFVAPGRPAGALLEKVRVIGVSDKNVPGDLLLLKMAFQAERRVTFVQQSLIDRTVR